MMPLVHARRSCVTKIMQQRTFAFQGSGPTAAQAEVRLWCREPPEAQAGKTLTWQLDSGDASGGQQPPDGAPPPAAAAAAQPAAAGSNVAPQEDPDLIGLDIWPASIALCRYLANHPEVVAGQQVVELGAGALPSFVGICSTLHVHTALEQSHIPPLHITAFHSLRLFSVHKPATNNSLPAPNCAGMGLVGLLCAALGAQHVLLTDYEPQVLAHLDKNAALNGLQKRCASLRLDWRQPAASLAQQQQGSWHRIVAADVLYASAVVQPLIATLRLLLHPEGGCCCRALCSLACGAVAAERFAGWHVGGRKECATRCFATGCSQ